MEKKTIAAILVVAVAFLLFAGNNMTYDTGNALAQQCMSAGGELTSLVTPAGVFQYCDGIYTAHYFLGNCVSNCS